MRYTLLVVKDGSNFLVPLIKHLCATIQVKAFERYIHVVLFIMLCKLFLTSISLWMKSQSVTIQMNAIE